MAGFQIDKEKLEQALPPPTSSTLEDLKWSGAVFGLVLVFIAWVVAVGWLLFRALS